MMALHNKMQHQDCERQNSQKKKKKDTAEYFSLIK